MCDKVNHKLKIIYAVRGCYGESEVVRWCSDCGGVVVDVDIDNRTNPGFIRKMELPKEINKI